MYFLFASCFFTVVVVAQHWNICVCMDNSSKCSYGEYRISATEPSNHVLASNCLMTALEISTLLFHKEFSAQFICFVLIY